MRFFEVFERQSDSRIGLPTERLFPPEALLKPSSSDGNGVRDTEEDSSIVASRTPHPRGSCTGEWKSTSSNHAVDWRRRLVPDWSLWKTRTEPSGTFDVPGCDLMHDVAILSLQCSPGPARRPDSAAERYRWRYCVTIRVKLSFLIFLGETL